MFIGLVIPSYSMLSWSGACDTCDEASSNPSQNLFFESKRRSRAPISDIKAGLHDQQSASAEARQWLSQVSKECLDDCAKHSLCLFRLCEGLCS